MLRDRWHLEISKDQDKDKNVIDTEGIFDEVAGKKIESAIGSQHLPNDQTEPEREQHPKQTAPRRRAHRQRTMASFEAGQINRDGDENANVKCDPKPNARGHGT